MKYDPQAAKKENYRLTNAASPAFPSKDGVGMDYRQYLIGQIAQGALAEFRLVGSKNPGKDHDMVGAEVAEKIVALADAIRKEMD